MPREVTLLCRDQVDARDVAEALVRFDPTWGVRALDGDTMVQVCCDAEHPIITVLGVRRIDGWAEIERILPDAPAMAVPVWWADTVTSFGSEGEAGIAAALDAALELDAVCVVHGD